MTLTAPDIPVEEILRKIARGRVAYSIHAPYENEVGVFSLKRLLPDDFVDRHS
jgi:hypothetical protein